MDIRWLFGALGALLIWAANTRVQFVMAGHLFVIPVLVILAALLVLVLVALIVWIVHSLAADGMFVRA